MTVVQKSRERICDDPVVHGSGEKALLGFARKLGPDLQGRVSEQRSKLIFIHERLPCLVTASGQRHLAPNPTLLYASPASRALPWAGGACWTPVRSL